MAALVQSFPQQSGTVTMLQARPTSASGILPMPQGQTGQSYPISPQRQSFYGGPNNVAGGSIVYRAAPAPIQPYAFTTTPSLNATPQRLQQQQQQQNVSSGTIRTSSTAPTLPRMQSFDSSISLGRLSHQPASASMINLPTNSTLSGGRYTFGSRDDSSLPNQGSRRMSGPQPQSSYAPGTASQSFAQAASTRASPERYRRAMPRTVTTSAASVQSQQQKGMSATTSGSGMAGVGHSYASGVSGVDTVSDYRLAVPNGQPQQQQQPKHYRRNSAHDAAMTTVDDLHLHRQSDENAKRFRRRSMPSVDFVNHTMPQVPLKKSETTLQNPDKDKSRVGATGNNLTVSGTMMRNKDGSSESVSSLGSASRPSPSSRNSSATAGPTVNPASSATNASGMNIPGKERDIQPQVNVPLRGSSDAANRVAASVSQSRPTAMDVAADSKKKSTGESVVSNRAAEDGAGFTPSQRTAKGNPSLLESPAMRHLSAINQKGGRLRSKTSRLRRAFSFGSAADFRTAADDEEISKDVSGAVSANGPQKDLSKEEIYDAEQARIAQQQEEAGIGSSIYAGARIFSGSTDNLSISSTASSASIMIRKMGRGMKKGTRSLVGLFRPKSIIGAPYADSDVAETDISATNNATIEATVSMVTAEAERERVNVNCDVRSQTAGGTGFPRLERNSIDASAVSSASDRLSSAGTDNSASRKSIVGGEKERADVLAAVRKGILKNTSGSRSPSSGPVEDRGFGLELPCPPAISDSPASSAPSTPNDESMGHKRTGSVAIGGEDYFVSALRLRQDSRSGNSTPHGSMRRNATFSPRIVFYDTWPSQEYDRRGEIATCNRLTPMLAQQIKEELNSFKMEMEVHENSKIYTHFF